MSVVPRKKYTPTEERIVKKLSDGMLCRPRELMLLLDDDQAGNGALHYHISNINRKLAPTHVIVSVNRNRVHYYQMFRRIDTSE